MKVSEKASFARHRKVVFPEGRWSPLLALCAFRREVLSRRYTAPPALVMFLAERSDARV